MGISEAHQRISFIYFAGIKESGNQNLKKKGQKKTTNYLTSMKNHHIFKRNGWDADSVENCIKCLKKEFLWMSLESLIPSDSHQSSKNIHSYQSPTHGNGGVFVINGKKYTFDPL